VSVLFTIVYWITEHYNEEGVAKFTNSIELVNGHGLSPFGFWLMVFTLSLIIETSATDK
jgi:hypothetical protein